MRAPFELAAIGEHLREAVVVLGGGNHAASARGHGGLSSVVAGRAAGTAARWNDVSVVRV